MQNTSKKQLSKLLDIPYTTLVDWSKNDEESWRFKLVVFLESLTEEEINLIKNRSKRIEG